jgi:PAS domain S-box-containing protein
MSAPAHEQVARLVTRLAAGLALFVALTPVLFYGLHVYMDAGDRLEADLHLQVRVIDEFIAQQPDRWEFNAERLQAILEPYLRPDIHYRVVGRGGQTLFVGGPAPAWHVLARSLPLHAFGHPVGRVEAGASQLPALLFGLLLFGVSGGVAWVIWGPVRRLPLRALREAELALLRRTLYQRALLDNFPFVAWLGDGEGRVLTANQRLADLLGTSVDALEGRRLVDALSPVQAELYARAEKRVLKTCKLQQREMLLEGPDGGRWFDVGLAPIYPAAGQQPVGTLGYARDITEEKGMKAALARYRSHLVEMVRERTAELAAALETAELASRAKTEFLASMSHELRTPLNAILGFAQLLAMDARLAPDVRDMVGEIEQAGRHLLLLVNDLIDIAQIESGKLELASEPVFVAAVVADSLEQVAAFARGHGVELSALECRCRTQPVMVLADYRRLTQVLVSLLVNGIKYNRPGGKVGVNCLRRAGKLRIQVEDTGPGIAADKLDRLFTPFDRLGAECGPVPGAGIGLALARRIVAAMGGAIGVDSVEGEGSVFWIELALYDEPRHSADGEAVPVLAAAPPARRLVLYVEDNQTNQELIQRFFARKRQDLALRGAASAEAGIEAARALAPALILMDINLPGMDGFEALKRLQADARTARVPVIAMSAHSLKEDVERGLRAGFADYVTKPIDLRQLLAVLDRLLPVVPAPPA